MANPQGNKNYTRIANGILEALASAKLSSYELNYYSYLKKDIWVSKKEGLDFTFSIFCCYRDKTVSYQ